jgi:hypothetical protein
MWLIWIIGIVAAICRQRPHQSRSMAGKFDMQWVREEKNANAVAR